MNKHINSYYAFGQQADRLIQISLRADGKVMGEIRALDPAVGWKRIQPVKAPTWLSAADATKAIVIEIKTPGSSCGILAGQGPGWDPEYRYPRMELLGYKAEPFGEDLNYQGASQAPNARLAPKSVYTFQDGLLVTTAPDGLYTSTVDVSKSYAAAGDPHIQCLVLRLCADNVGVITISNVSAPGGILVLRSEERED